MIDDKYTNSLLTAFRIQGVSTTHSDGTEAAHRFTSDQPQHVKEGVSA